MNKKNWTGERLETFVVDETMTEHLHRYAVARQYVKGKAVLDIACGEGYGSRLLSQNALAVTGVDIDAATIDHAAKKYTARNLSFVKGDIVNIPFEAASFDVVVSFETLEHTDQHQKALSEIKRVLRPGGILLISTPEKKKYTDAPGNMNPFHKKELYRDEFVSLLAAYFRHQIVCHQALHVSSIILPPAGRLLEIYSGNYEQVIAVNNIEPLYLLAVCSDDVVSSPAATIFTGAGVLDNVIQEKEKAVMDSITYKTGQFMLTPVKLLMKLLRPSKKK
jgi:ubiquinone/menaquinone biosynthesis C-methylase UbiE